MAVRFYLWNPIIDENRMECCFDVTPYDIQLRAGTLELMREFLRYLKIEAEPRNWQIEPFCSAYYSDDYYLDTAEHYQDRHRIAWRVKISFAEPCSEDSKIGLCLFEPIGVDAVDHSWYEEDNSWNWTSMVYVAIADFNPWDWEKLLEDDLLTQELAFFQCQSIESTYLKHYVFQARFKLGLIHFPDEEDRVMEFLRTCEKYNASINWAKTMRGWI